MRTDTVSSGLPAIGDVPWGTHFCQFYETGGDLADTLVPYFKAGIDGNESCMWVTAPPFRAEDAKAALRNAVPDLDKRLKKEQIEIVDYEEWYLRGGTKQTADSVLAGWLERKDRALANGYAGFRLTGNTYWLEREDWAAFTEYEEKVNACFCDHRVLALCSYCLGRCEAGGVLDVVRNHQFALIRRQGDWEVIESAALKVAKEELRRANEELEVRVRERTAELRAALAARDEFFSVASHELRTPVTALQLHLDGILMMLEGRKLSPEEQSRRLARAQKSCVRLGKLIDELLDVSRAAAGTLRVEREEMDLAVMACEVVGRFTEQARRAGCRLFVDAARPVVGLWDRTRLEQVLDNLLANAIAYAPGKPVTVAASLEGRAAVISVRDAGPGIAPENQRRVFERFVRIGDERTASGGFGLGLWIVRQIVEAHGGTISLHSAPGEGCLFRIELPQS